MSSPYQWNVAELQRQILNTSYFPDLWFKVLEKFSMTTQGITDRSYASSDLTEMLNDFWFKLPDELYIRVDPFFLLCDLCEGDTE